MEFKQTMRMSAIKKLIPTAHLEKRIGTRTQAREYCMKEESRISGPYEHGTWNTKGQGNRSDLDSVVSMIQDRKSTQEIAQSNPIQFIKYYKGIEKLQQHYLPEQRIPEVFVLWGKPGVGKTRLVHDNFDDIYTVPDQASFTHFTGYNNNYCVLFDDFYGGIKYSLLLKLLDRYPYNVNTKGGTTYWNPGLIVITSNKHPAYWYDRDECDALLRRITKIYHIQHQIFEH